MIDPFVAEIILATEGKGDTVVNFQQVISSNKEAASWTLPFLKSEQFGFLASHQGVLFEPLRPVHQITIIGTGLTTHFDVMLLECMRMLSDRKSLFVTLFVCHMSSKAEASVHLTGVLLSQPLFTLPRMASLFPLGQLSECDVLTGTKHA
jgi:hypothetical protein